MNFFADKYQFRARIIPEFLTVLPLVMLLATFVEDLLVVGFLSIALFFIFFQGVFSSRLGRKLESRLRGQKELVRNSDFLIDLHCKDENSEFIKLFERAVCKSEYQNPFSFTNHSDKTKQINQVITWMREQTRDNEKFPAVFDKLCDYGFYRNMLAMKRWALGFTLLSIVLLIWPTISITASLSIKFPTSGICSENCEIVVSSMWTVLAIAWVFFWTCTISLNALQQANNSYIETLLKAIEGIDVKNP